MKKIIFIAAALVGMSIMASCGNKASKSDVVVDSTVVDSLVDDTISGCDLTDSTIAEFDSLY